MNWLSSWWYGPPAPVSRLAPEKNPVSLEDTADAMHAKRLHMLKKAADLLKEAKQHKANGDTARALTCMKRKQQADLMAKQMEGQLLNLEKASLAVDSAHVTADLADAMKQGAAELKVLAKQVNIDDIDSVADDLDDGMRDMYEISEALARPLGGGMAEENEDEILAEMEGWETKSQTTEPSGISFPPVPTGTPVRRNGGGGNGGQGELVRGKAQKAL